MHRHRTWILTCAALVAFAANSLLCRLALRPRLVDAATFTSVRLLSGALVLGALVRRGGAARPRGAGRWGSAAALFAYAVAFSFAYLRIGAAVGALILFGAVQVTMIGWGLVRGERPSAAEWGGLSLAILGLALLPLPGWQAPDRWGEALMAVAGAAWGVYSLKGRGTTHPLAATADNFARSLPFALIATLLTVAHAHASTRGIVLAAASGALASGVGYSIWYAALPGLSASRASIVQLAVPVLAAAGAVVLLGEQVTPRLLVAAAAILGGIAVAVAGRKPVSTRV